MTIKDQKWTMTIIVICAILLVLCAMLLVQCALLKENTTKKQDSEAPVIVLWGDSPISTASPRELPPVISIVTPQQPSELVQRYSGVTMTAEERRELAGIIQLEAGNQCTEGQQAVVEVVLNRVLSPEFPDTVHDVLHQGEDTKRPQFSTIENLASAEPTAAQYEAIDAALYGPSILPEDVVFFSRNGENDRVWGKIQDHVFCYKYIWE